jgi:putative two-component system hydrogenase maturation factor HypX/HoxX
VGDRGPSSLDWAIELGARDWGVTVLEANGDFDAGDVWATRTFPMRESGKGSIYRHEVRRTAIEALMEAVNKVLVGGAPEAFDEHDARAAGRARPLMKQDVRAIDWRADPTETVLRKVRAAEGHPGVLDEIAGVDFHLFGVHRERGLRGAPGEIVAQRHGAICRATVDGAVWVTHLRRSVPQETHFKLPATLALKLAGRPVTVREVAGPLHDWPGAEHTLREIVYEEDAGVGYLHFDFYNGAMSTEQCRRLRAAYLYARSRRRTKVIVLMGGRDFFSNGIHLNVIEAADDPAGESWRNLHAINDLVREIVETDSHLVISALAGDAAAGGVPFALAADRVYAREDVVLNPYYGHMGGLYGSEYWTYLLPRRVGAKMTARLTGPPFTPLGTAQAVEIGVLDAAFGATADSFQDQIRLLARGLASDPT